MAFVQEFPTRKFETLKRESQNQSMTECKIENRGIEILESLQKIWLEEKFLLQRKSTHYTTLNPKQEKGQMQPRNSKQVPKVNQTKNFSNPREKEIYSHCCRELRLFFSKILCTNLSQTQTEPGRQNHQSFLLPFKCKNLGFKHKNPEKTCNSSHILKF